MRLRTYFLGFCALLAVGCQTKSGNIWEDNQKQENTASLLWENSSSQVGSPFLPLNEADLKNQFADLITPQTGRELGDAGMPTADQFEVPRGELASIFTPIFFNTDEHVLKRKADLQLVERAAAYLRSHVKTYVIIEGHCDERGPEAYNLALGTRRANHIRALLIKAGAKTEQIHTVSLGKEHPFAVGHSPEAWQQNRRAHFRVHMEGQ